MMKTNEFNRLHIVDALRGFALVSIMLLHNIEHFDFYYHPPGQPDWLNSLDKMIWEGLFFLFAGKSYAIFALLFGLTFHLQWQRQLRAGKDFSIRFLWRMLLLLCFGFVNAAFYQGDILMMYALLGIVMIPFVRLNDRIVFVTALLLLLQPFEWIAFFQASNGSDGALADPASWAYFGQMSGYIPKQSMIDTIVGNLTNGRLAVTLWNWENGRVVQTFSLFLFGMLAGRRQLFEITESSMRFWIRTLLGSIVFFLPLYYLKVTIPTAEISEAMRRPFESIVSSWANITFMAVAAASFVLLFRNRKRGKSLFIFKPLGRMSLTNYILQSVVGSFLYYGYGLALYQYTGASISLLIGIALATMQTVFSRWWMQNHAQGPLEILWHKATWLSFRKD